VVVVPVSKLTSTPGWQTNAVCVFLLGTYTVEGANTVFAEVRVCSKDGRMAYCDNFGYKVGRLHSSSAPGETTAGYEEANPKRPSPEYLVCVEASGKQLVFLINALGGGVRQ
jgi:hypothetical protein